jgi:hypothetical protein
VYFINGQNKLIALDSADGSLRWAAQLAAAPHYLLVYNVASTALFAVLGGGESTGRDLFLRFGTDGALQFSQWLPQRATSTLVALDDGVALAVAPNRDSFRRQLLGLSSVAGAALQVEATESLPQALVNGQSTLSPPWPAIE